MIRVATIGVVVLAAMGCETAVLIGSRGEPAPLWGDGGLPDAGAPDGGFSPCLFSGWCWENPSPQGHDLSAFWALGDALWAVGEHGTAVHWTGQRWRFSNTATQDALYDVWGLSAHQVWAVGERGLILRWDGAGWSSTRVEGSKSLHAVWGSDDQNVWAAGAEGVLHWDGEAWRPTYATSESLLALWGRAANEVWAVGTQGTIIRWDGAEWKKELAPVQQDLTGLWGDGGDQLWAVGKQGTLLQRVNGQWIALSQGISEDLHAIGGNGAGEVWAVGDGVTLRWDGTSWVQHPTGLGVGDGLRAVGSAGPHGTWAVGTSGIILQWSGAQWERASPGARGATSVAGAVWASDEDQPWATIDNQLWRREGSEWRAVDLGGASAVGLAGFGPNEVWVVHGSAKASHLGVVSRWDGATWTALSTGTQYGLTRIWGSDANNLWVASSGGGILQWDGSQWHDRSFGAVKVRALGGTGRTDVWVAGENLLRRWNGQQWLAVPGFPSGRFVIQGLWAFDSAHLWLVGTEGLLWFWNGQTLKAHPVSGPTPTLSSVWGRGPHEVFAAGHHGTLLRWNGVDWNRLDLGVSPEMTFLTVGGTSTRFWVGGARGAILSYDFDR